MTIESNPYPGYARQRQGGPVHQTRLSNGMDAWIVTRYADVRTVLTHSAISKDLARVTGDDGIPDLNHTDPPEHTRLRKLVGQAFGPRRIDALESRITALAEDLIGRFAADGHADLIAQFAVPFPVAVICELLGIPEADRPALRRLSVELLTGDDHERAHAELSEQLGTVIRVKRETGDLIGTLLPAVRAGELSWAELTSMVLLILVAGHETTANLIGNGMAVLLANPGEADRLRGQPALLTSAVEELLRYESPVQMGTYRYATADIELPGALIPAGSTVIVNLASANRDTAHIADADRLDIGRSANGHLAFGAGIHYCLGARLARIEGRIAFATLLRRLPGMRLAVRWEELPWQGTMIMRGLAALPVAF